MSKLFIIDTLAWAALFIVWSNDGWYNKAIRLGFAALMLLHIWRGPHGF